MNAIDFAKWWEDFERRFPSKSSWANGDGERGTVETWHDVLHPCDVRDAIEANKRFQEGVESWPNDWEQIPVAIRDVAGKCRVARINRELVNSYAQGEPDNIDGQCALCYDGGLVLLKGHKSGNVEGWACRCRAGAKWRKQVKIKSGPRAGETRQLAPTYQDRRYAELDEWNDEPAVISGEF